MNCYCQSGRTFGACCEPYLGGDQSAPSAEKLMRSRYSAFCTKNIDYVEETTDPQGDFDREAALGWMNEAEFWKLEILKSSEEGTKGVVEFKAYFRTPAGEQIHHEVSRFRKQAGVWFFRDGRVIAPPPPV